MTTTTIGLLHPGAMGVTLGNSAVSAGHPVLWAGDQRSEASHDRAQSAGLTDVHTVEALVSQSDIIFSICPPHAAVTVAESVAQAGFKGIFVDANAVSTDTTATIQSIIESKNATFVDGGIIGPPAVQQDTTRLYVSGPAAGQIEEIFEETLMQGLAISEHIGDASALKMAYAAYTKGHSALLLLSRALAKANGIEKHLLNEWALSQPHLASLCEREGRTAAKKAWRFNGEMREIANTMEHSALPGDIHEGAAKIYDRLVSFQHSAEAPSVADTLEQLVKNTD
ncbi:hypothetical protein AB833_07810 [Chromatiales bacterium (ex Bugula neritina AB1)]|nr:hypothetical protein AB833_07810 [Chromatiales bacterium (ex Bugula neritina AB1)]